MGNQRTDPFEEWTVEELSEYVYGASFTAKGVGDAEAFKRSLVESAKRVDRPVEEQE